MLRGHDLSGAGSGFQSLKLVAQSEYFSKLRQRPTLQGSAEE